MHCGLAPCLLLQLEFIGGEVWANVWQSECIARICPDTGRVKAWLLMQGLAQSLQQRNLATVPMDVLNGEVVGPSWRQGSMYCASWGSYRFIGSLAGAFCSGWFSPA